MCFDHRACMLTGLGQKRCELRCWGRGTCRKRKEKVPALERPPEPAAKGYGFPPRKADGGWLHNVFASIGQLTAQPVPANPHGSSTPQPAHAVDANAYAIPPTRKQTREERQRERLLAQALAARQAQWRCALLLLFLLDLHLQHIWA